MKRRSRRKGYRHSSHYRRKGFDLAKFDRFVATQWPGNVIRTKGVLYFNSNRDMSLLFEQSAVQKN